MKTQIVESRRHIIDLQHSRVRRLRHRSRHTQTFWTNPKTWLITLTYRPGQEPDKAQWSAAMGRFRKWYRNAHRTTTQPNVLWVRELTKRGVLHYHAVINGNYPGKWDKLGIWPHGHSQTKLGRGDTCSAYLLKYASKLDSKLTGDFKHWRLYGFTGLNQEQRRAISYQMLPGWIRETFPLHLVKSPSARTLKTGQKIQSGWTYGGSAYQAQLPHGWGSLVYLGYCVIPSILPDTETGAGGGKREAPPPVTGACYF